MVYTSILAQPALTCEKPNGAADSALPAAAISLGAAPGCMSRLLFVGETVIVVSAVKEGLRAQCAALAVRS